MAQALTGGSRWGLEMLIPLSFGDDEELAFECASSVEAFHGDAVDDRGITDDGDGAAALGVGLRIEATRLRVSPRAMPTAVEMAVPAWPTRKRSKLLSAGSGKPDMPLLVH